MKPPIPINIPATATISNFLYEGMSPQELNQDIVVVSLANGYAIEVDWVPENDPNGSFCVRALWKFDEVARYETKDVHAVASAVSQLSKHFDREQIAVSRSSQVKPATVVV
jgi:hypothetical protein